MELQPLTFKNLQDGLISEGAVSEDLYPATSVSESINFNFDKIGCATLRKGTTALGDQLSGNILGLYEFRDSGSGTNNQIIAVNGTTVYYLSSGTWTSKRTVTTGLKADFTTYLDYVFMVNGTDATAIWDGNPSNSFVTTGNAADAPTGKYIENFRSRVWIAGNSTYPDRLYYSSLPSSVTTPIITWDTSVTTGDWIDISPSDGDNTTYLKRTKSAMLVFKKNHIYRVYSISETEPDPKINVGTWSQKSVVEAKDGVYFHHPSGFYKYADNKVQEISKPIDDIVNAITLANYSKISGFEDGDHIEWQVGDCTVNGVAYTNLSVRYTISTQTWTHYSYPTQHLVSSKYNDGTTIYNLVGDDDGNILKMATGKTDNTSSIQYSLIHKWLNFDGLLSTRKNINKLLFAHKGGAGSSVTYQKEDDSVNDWSKSLKGRQLCEGDTGFDLSIKGKKLRFRISGSSTGEPFTYSGFEFVEGQSNKEVYGR